MKYIAHRGNTLGPNILFENAPDYIDTAIEKGFDVEIDLWYNKFDDDYYLGHDEPRYKIDSKWLEKNSDMLWIHCKNIECLCHLDSSFNYFWHENDSFTLTSKGNIWTYPGKIYTPNSIVVMPETFLVGEIAQVKEYNCFGICSDYVEKIK
jgi:hypothetical protein